MTQLYAGVGRVLITPSGAGYLAGDVLDTDAEVRRVHRDLYAQSLFLTDRKTRLVLITVDVCKVSAAMLKAVVTGLGEELDLPDAAIMIAASHTHSAPHTFEGDAVPGAFDKGFAEEAAAGMIASALQAAGNLEPVSLRYERGHSDLGVNKRVSTPWGVFMRANPAGAYDPEVGVLIAERAAGKPVAVLCCYASHPIGHLRSEISSDLTGFLRDELEAAFPNSMGFHALGCAGDVSPRMRWDGTDYEIGNPHTGAGRRLLPEPAFKNMMEVAGKELASKAIELVKGRQRGTLRRPALRRCCGRGACLGPAALAGAGRGRRVAAVQSPPRQLGRAHASEAPGRRADCRGAFPIRCRCGESRIACALSGSAAKSSPASDCASRLRCRLFPALRSGMPTSIADTCPRAPQLLEGGYEAESFYNTMLPAPYATGIDDVLVAAAVNLARGTGDGPNAA